MTHQSGNFLVPQSSGTESKLKKIRCRQCGKSALENLVVCPFCGRELHPAPPRIVTWGVPVVLVIFFALVVTGWGSSNPIAWTAQQWERGSTLLGTMGQRIEPRLAVSEAPAVDSVQQPVAAIPAPAEAVESVAEPAAPAANPAANAGDPPPAAQVAPEAPTEPPTTAPTATPADTATATATATAPPTATETRLSAGSDRQPIATQTAVDTPTSTATATPAGTATQTPTRAASIAQLRATQTPATGDDGVVSASSADGAGSAAEPATVGPTPRWTDTATPTRTPTATASPTATATSRSTNTPTPEPLSYEVQPGDTLLGIANRFGTTVDTLMAVNGLSQEDVRSLRLGQVLIIPGRSEAAASGSSAELESYTVQTGDTPTSIANRFGVTVDALMTVNGMSRDDATRLRTGQVLLIPRSGSTSSSSTSGVSTSSAAVASAAAAPVADEENFRLDAPRLRSPQDGTPIQCNREDNLVWNPVPYIGLDDKYILRLGYVSGYSSGEAEVTWVLTQQRDSTRTSWEMDGEYCALAPQDLGRQWRWYVEVVNENGVPISPPSEIWSFTWN